MCRSVFMTFYGESRVDPETAHHIHESPSLMTVPLMILAFLSLVGGFVGIPIFEGLNRFGDFVAPVFAPATSHSRSRSPPGTSQHLAGEIILMAVSLAIAIFGLLFAYRVYVTDPSEADRMVERFGWLHKLVYNKYWMDEIYDVLFVKSIVEFSRFLWSAFDEG